MKRFPSLLFVPIALLSACSRPPSAEKAELADDAASWRKIDADFAHPPAEFRLIQFSGHDGELLPVDQMAETGIGGVELFMQRKGYLTSDEAWENMRRNIEAAKKAGLQVWVADDNGYPSGMAGGVVVAADPALEARGLAQVVRDGAGPGAVRLDLPAGAEKFVHAFLYPLANGKPVLEEGKPVAVQAGYVETEGLEGPWRLSAYALQVVREGNTAILNAPQFLTNGLYPNLLQPAAMEKFVSLTHEEYARRFSPLEGKIDAFIFNEPILQSYWAEHQPRRERPGGVALIPWDADLPRRFQQEHGYDLMPLLPALYGGDDATSKLARRHFYETVGTIMAENFSGRIAGWAENSGTLAAGHPVMEEVMIHHAFGYGDLFRFVEPMHIPTCDVPMPDPGDPWNFWMPKLFGSIAQAYDRDTVACLLDPLLDRPVMNLTPTPEQFRRIVNMAVFGGVNQFQTYLRWAEYDPSVYRGMSEYTGRLAAVLRGARSAATVALYYPIETFQAEFVPTPAFVHTPAVVNSAYYPEEWSRMQEMREGYDTIAESFFTKSIDFNWLNGESIAKGRVENGTLIAANGRYTTIVMPQVELLPLDVAEKIAEFQKAGGKVVWVNSLPQLGDAPGEHEQVSGLFAGQQTVRPGEVVAAIGRVVPPGFELRTDDIPMIARFTRDGRRINYLVNYRPQLMTVPLESAGDAPLSVQVYNPLDGSITTQQTPATVTIPPQSSLIVTEDPLQVPVARSLPAELTMPPSSSLFLVEGD
jgi:hypothetical protein